MEKYLYYDSKRAVTAVELRELYRFTSWGRCRSVEQISRMIEGTDMCFSVRCDGKLIAFCRVVTDFIFRASLWDVIVHPDHQGRGLGSKLISYALDHPAMIDIPMVITYSSELGPFLSNLGFSSVDGTMMLLRRPLEFS